MSQQRLMKDGLDAGALRRITAALSATIANFPSEHCYAEMADGLETLELKQRVTHIIAVLHCYLADDFAVAAEQLMAIKPVWDYGNEDDPLSGFAAWPLIDYIGVHGLAHPQQSLKALRHLTPLFSAEFAIRPFIQRHPELVCDQLASWCDDPDAHVRRLVSEGTRPRLPWGQQLPQFIADPAPAIELLERLKDDESEYVRRSVANNLNDISKDHPHRVITICRNWLKPSDRHRSKLIRHATRTLVKQGHPDVFPLLGFTASPQLNVSTIQLDRTTVTLGESLSFNVELLSTASEAQKLVIDYAMYHMKANGQIRAKVFKWRGVTLAADSTIELSRCHPFKKITTRRYYAGRHAVALLINGVEYGRADFELRL